MDFDKNNRPLSSIGHEQSTMLIGTKLNVPPMKSKMVPRPHLVNRLSEGRDCRLIVISGMAGSGKTSLACQWVSEEELTAVWYSLDENDNDADLFFRYLLTALSGVDNDFAAAAKPLLQAQKQLSGKEVIPLLIESLTEAPQDIYIVLDDYHAIYSQEIHDALSYLLDYAPPRIHMVIISRHAVPLPLSRLRVRGQLVEIHASDMRFTDEETEQFFREIMPVKLSSDEVHELARYAEGWVGGLQLFGLSLKGKESLDGLGNVSGKVSQEVLGYVLEEIIRLQPERVASFLWTTALLDRFNVDLCRAVTGLEDAFEIIEHLYRINLFLIPLDAEHSWHRYHHLVSEAVRERVKRSSPVVFSETHRKAALWFAKNGYPEDAFRHAFASEDMEFAADMLEDHLLSLHEHCEVASGLRWLGKVPHAVFVERALLRLYECSLKISSLQFRYIEAVLEDIENRETELFERYEGLKKKVCQDLAAHLRHVLPYLCESVSMDQTLLSRDFQRIFSRGGLFPGIIEDLVVGQHLFLEDMRLVAGALKDTSAKVFLSESVWTRVIWYHSMAYVERWQGKLDGSESALKEALAFLDKKGLAEVPFRFMFYPAMAWIHYFRNDLDAALGYANMAVEHAEQIGSVKDIVEGNIVLAFICMAAGDGGRMKDTVKRIRWVSETMGNPSLIVLTNTITAGLSLAAGDVGWVREWMQSRQPFAEEPVSFCCVHEGIIRAQLLFQERDYDGAVRILEVLRNQCADRNVLELVLGIDLFLAAALYVLNDSSRAQTILDGALNFAEAQGYVRQGVHYTPAISAVLMDMRRARPQSSGRMLHLAPMIGDGNVNMGDPGAHDGVAKRSICGLTPREMEILELMAAGCKDREIAEKAFISRHTVKTHSKRIFQKLGVNTRLQAILRSREL